MNGQNLGDIHPKMTDPVETYFDTLRRGIPLTRKKWIVKPEWEPRPVLSPDKLVGELIAKQQEMLESHTLPRMWQIMMDFWTRMQCGMYFVKRESCIVPPVIAQPIDSVSETTVAVSSHTADRQVVSYTVPDGVVGSILRFGHMLEDSSQWTNLRWNIKVNSKPVRAYQDFIQQRGNLIDPTDLACHIPLKHGDLVEVTARRAAAGAAINTYARLMGFAFPASEISQTGTYSQYHTT